MVSNNIPQVKLGIIAVSRDCFPIALSTQRRENIVKEYKGEIFNCQTTVENEKDMLKAVAEVKEQGCNALVVFLGNFGPETPETLIAKNFDGPVMFVAAAEGDGDMINGRGDAYCGMLNCSYNLGMRHLKGYIPEYPVGTAEEVAKMIADFVPVARVIIGLKGLKIITFGPRPQDFFACNAPIKGLYELGVEIEENSELDLLVAYKEHANDPRIDEVCADMAKEMATTQLHIIDFPCTLQVSNLLCQSLAHCIQPGLQVWRQRLALGNCFSLQHPFGHVQAAIRLGIGRHILYIAHALQLIKITVIAAVQRHVSSNQRAGGGTAAAQGCSNCYSTK